MRKKKINKTLIIALILEILVFGCIYKVGLKRQYDRLTTKDTRRLTRKGKVDSLKIKHITEQAEIVEEINKAIKTLEEERDRLINEK